VPILYAGAGACSGVLQWALGPGGGIGEGADGWRCEFLPSKNLGSGIHLIMKRTLVENYLLELGRRYQSPFLPI
jgi:hypothetical protein